MKETVYGLVNDELEIGTLEDLCVSGGIQTGPFGSQLHQKDYLPVGTPIITVEHLGENRVLHQDLPHVSDEDKERLSRYVMQKGDIIFSRVGSVDRRALVRDEEDGWLFSGRCLRVRPDNTKIDSDYLSWFFGLEIFKDYIRRIAVGATMPSLNTQLLSNVPVIFPPLAEQRIIAEILNALDDKIELNRRMNRTLESMARAVFRRWFVENEDVGDWEVKRIGEFVTVIDHVANGSFALLRENVRLYDEPEYAIFVRTTDSRSNFEGPLKYVDKKTYDFLKKTQLNGREFIISNVGDTGSIFRAPHWLGQPMVLGNNAILIRANEYTDFLFHLFTSEQGQTMIDSIVTGSVQMKFNKTDFRALKISLPPKDVLKRFNEFIVPIQDKITQNIKESRTLASLRDSLLPRLMRGEVRVKEVDV